MKHLVFCLLLLAGILVVQGCGDVCVVGYGCYGTVIVWCDDDGEQHDVDDCSYYGLGCVRGYCY